MEDAKDIAAPMADMAVGASATPSSLPQVTSPPLTPPGCCKTGASGGAACAERSTTTPTYDAATAAVAGSSAVPAVDDALEAAEFQRGAGRDVDSVDGGEESVEDLLSSLMHTLNTEQGRADFRLLAAACDSSAQAHRHDGDMPSI